jgi:mannose-6-phosphate isomerase-like protein (cupin superfamily)
VEKIIEELKKTSRVKKGKSYLVSNVSDEMLNGPMRGWICGHFYPKESDFHRHDIEICFKTLSVGKSEKLHYHLCSFEFLIVLTGEVEYELEGDHITLTPGMFYMLQPGSTEHIVDVRKETTILAIRLPSIPNNKIYVDDKF